MPFSAGFDDVIPRQDQSGENDLGGSQARWDHARDVAQWFGGRRKCEGGFSPDTRAVFPIIAPYSYRKEPPEALARFKELTADPAPKAPDNCSHMLMTACAIGPVTVLSKGVCEQFASRKSGSKSQQASIDAEDMKKISRRFHQ
ncbi:MAG: hypothetical protein K2Y51_04915 [Gammaproteobacteria bacterium]|nr:hypothetical protein [Gammaproteobacteria bacterium]